VQPSNIILNYNQHFSTVFSPNGLKPPSNGFDVEFSPSDLGLSITGQRTLSGKPEITGPWNLTVTISDTIGCHAIGQYSGILGMLFYFFAFLFLFCSFVFFSFLFLFLFLFFFFFFFSLSFSFLD
jgi:hypothetical protein